MASQLQSQIAIRAVHEPERQQGDEDLTDCSDGERAPALFSEFANLGAETHSRKRQ